MEAKGWTAVRIFRLAVLGILAVALLTGGTLRLRDALANEDVAAPDFNLLTEEELAGTPYVSGNVELVLDCFAESYTTRNDVRVSDESDELYYLVPAAPTDSEGYYHCTYLLCLEVRPEHFAVMDQIMDETWDENFTGDEYTRFEIGTSRVTSMESDLLALREEYAEEVGLVDWLAESELLGTTDEAEIRAHPAVRRARRRGAGEPARGRGPVRGRPAGAGRVPLSAAAPAAAGEPVRTERRRPGGALRRQHARWRRVALWRRSAKRCRSVP